MRFNSRRLTFVESKTTILHSRPVHTGHYSQQPVQRQGAQCAKPEDSRTASLALRWSSMPPEQSLLPPPPPMTRSRRHTPSPMADKLPAPSSRPVRPCPFRAGCLQSTPSSKTQVPKQASREQSRQEETVVRVAFVGMRCAQGGCWGAPAFMPPQQMGQAYVAASFSLFHFTATTCRPSRLRHARTPVLRRACCEDPSTARLLHDMRPSRRCARCWTLRSMKRAHLLISRRGWRFLAGRHDWSI